MRPIQALRGALCTCREKMRGVYFSDQGQKRAFGNLMRFFAVMLVLTLIARGTAGATVPQVDAVYPVRGEILQQVTLEGTISAAGRTQVSCPAGLTVSALLVRAGEQVAAGQEIARFDPEEVSMALQRAQVQVQQLDAQAAGEAAAIQQPDAGTVGSAQLVLDAAYQDLAAAQAALDGLTADPNADAAAVEAARQALDTATRAAQSAEYARNSALANYQQQQQQAELAARNSEAAAAGLALDRQQVQETIAQLSELQAAGCVLTAPVEGTLLSWNLTEGAASTAAACTIASGADGYVMEVTLDADAAKLASVGAHAQVRQGNVEGEAELTSLSSADTEGRVNALVRLPAEQAWKEGRATGVITLSRTQHELCVPASAVGQDNQGYFVYQLQQQETVLGQQTVLVRTTVAVEERGTDQVAVSGALSASSQVVTGSSKPLSNGDRVRVRT